MTTITPVAPLRGAAFADMAHILARVVKLLGRPLTPEEVSEAIDAAVAGRSERPSQADMSALLAAFSTRAQPRDDQGRFGLHAPEGLTPEARRKLLGATAVGQSILDREDKETRARGRSPAGREVTPAAGHAVQDAQERHLREQQRDHPHLDRMSEAERGRALSRTSHGQLVLDAQKQIAEKTPWQTPFGNIVHTSPARYRQILGLTGMGQQVLAGDDRIARARGIPYARPLHDGARA